MKFNYTLHSNIVLLNHLNLVCKILDLELIFLLKYQNNLEI